VISWGHSSYRCLALFPEALLLQAGLFGAALHGVRAHGRLLLLV
jgi:hypothetical protein